MENPYPLDLSLNGHVILVSYNDKQLALSNSAQTIGAGPSEIPVRKYLKPSDLEFNLDEMKFYSRNKLPDIVNLTNADELYKLDLVDDGFYEF